MPKGKPNIFIEGIHDAHNHDIRKMYFIAVGLTGILCKISLQFCCEFIDNNRSNIFTNTYCGLLSLLGKLCHRNIDADKNHSFPS